MRMMSADIRWDGENRLAYIGCNPDAPPGDYDLKEEFTYDYLGRRIQAVVTYWDPELTPPAWHEYTRTKYVWSGWLLLLELDGSDNIVRRYTWGLDLAGQNGQINSLEDAGGIGGLLAVYDLNDTPGAASNPGTPYSFLCAQSGDTSSIRTAQSGDTILIS